MIQVLFYSSIVVFLFVVSMVCHSWRFQWALSDLQIRSGWMDGRSEQGGEREKNSMRASTVPCGIQVLCGERVLDQCHERAGQKTAREGKKHSAAQKSLFFFF